jgi:hypothetical protein
MAEQPASSIPAAVAAAKVLRIAYPSCLWTEAKPASRPSGSSYGLFPYELNKLGSCRDAGERHGEAMHPAATACELIDFDRDHAMAQAAPDQR